MEYRETKPVQLIEELIHECITMSQEFQHKEEIFGKVMTDKKDQTYMAIHKEGEESQPIAMIHESQMNEIVKQWLTRLYPDDTPKVHSLNVNYAHTTSFSGDAIFRARRESMEVSE